MEKIFRRKKELIYRDEKYKELLATFDKIIGSRKKQHSKELLIEYRIDDPVINEIKQSHRWTDKKREEHQKKFPDYWKLLQLGGEICSKWHVRLGFNFSSREVSISPYTNDEIILVGSPPLMKGYKGLVINDFNKYPLLNWIPQPNPFNKETILADINEFTTPGYNKTGETWIPILVNTTRLNANDAKWIKKEVWKIISNRLKKTSSKKPYDEYKECAFLYSLRREDTFQNYLRWYDIHFEERLTLRAIAEIHHLSKKSTRNAEALLEIFLQKSKVKVRRPIKEESAVLKGVRTIYQAISREPYRKHIQKDFDDKYERPKGVDESKYREQWLARFNRFLREEPASSGRSYVENYGDKDYGSSQDMQVRETDRYNDDSFRKRPLSF